MAPLPRDPDKRKKKEKPTTGRVRNKTESQWENYLPVFKQRKKKRKEKDKLTIVASHPTWPWQKEEKRETHTCLVAKFSHPTWPWQKKEKRETHTCLVAKFSHPTWPWQKKEKRETHTWKRNTHLFGRQVQNLSVLNLSNTLQKLKFHIIKFCVTFFMEIDFLKLEFNVKLEFLKLKFQKSGTLLDISQTLVKH